MAVRRGGPVFFSKSFFSFPGFSFACSLGLQGACFPLRAVVVPVTSSYSSIAANVRAHDVVSDLGRCLRTATAVSGTRPI